MYIYNVTVNIDESVHKEWLVWIKAHIPEVLDSGCFTSAKMTQVLVKEEMGGVTYSIQYTAPNLEALEEYYKVHAPKLRSDGAKKFADKMVAFRTELKIVEEFFPTAVSN